MQFTKEGMAKIQSTEFVLVTLPTIVCAYIREQSNPKLLKNLSPNEFDEFARGCSITALAWAATGHDGFPSEDQIEDVRSFIRSNKETFQNIWQAMSDSFEKMHFTGIVS